MNLLKIPSKSSKKGPAVLLGKKKKPKASTLDTMSLGVNISNQPTRVQFWSHIARLTNYDLNRMAEYFEITKRQLTRCFRVEMARSPQDWLYEQRIIAARVLLMESGSIKQVSTELGFKQLSHFCRQFKLYYGMTPTEFLANQANRGAKCLY